MTFLRFPLDYIRVLVQKKQKRFFEIFFLTSRGGQNRFCFYIGLNKEKTLKMAIFRFFWIFSANNGTATVKRDYVKVLGITNF